VGGGEMGGGRMKGVGEGMGVEEMKGNIKPTSLGTVHLVAGPELEA